MVALPALMINSATLSKQTATELFNVSSSSEWLDPSVTLDSLPINGCIIVISCSNPVLLSVCVQRAEQPARTVAPERSKHLNRNRNEMKSLYNQKRSPFSQRNPSKQRAQDFLLD